MKFRKTQDFVMYHDITDGGHEGWTITFTQTHLSGGKSRCEVMATSPTGRIMRGRTEVARIFPIEDWPPFAIDSFDQQVESELTEGLF